MTRTSRLYLVLALLFLCGRTTSFTPYFGGRTWRCTTHSRVRSSAESPQSLRRIVLNESPADDNDEDSSLSALENQIVLSLSAKGYDVFHTAAAGSSVSLSMESLLLWEQKMEAAAAELRLLTDKNIILKVYSSILQTSTLQMLDPLQMTSFQVLANAIADTLLSLYPKNTPITGLIDEITDVHLSFIETFQKLIDDGGDDGYMQSSAQEDLTYQYAGMVRYMYTKVSASLGADFESTSSLQDMRVNHWASPVFARLQRRFVRFQASGVEERVEEMNAAAFDSLIEKLRIDVKPRYFLSGPLLDSTTANSGASSSSSSSSRSLPAWDLAEFVLKVLRNSVGSLIGGTESMGALESKVSRVFRNSLSARMRDALRPLERVQANRGAFLEDTELKYVEDMLNLGHEAVAAVFATWQIRHNIVGVEDPETGELRRDFILPVALYQPQSGEPTTAVQMLDSLPVEMRYDAQCGVESLTPRLKPSTLLESTAVLSHAVRETAAEEFRALSTYYIDPDETPINRDGVYISVLSELLTQALVSPTFQPEWLYENLLACSALEETIGAREPRAASAKAYELSLSYTALQLLANRAAPPADMRERVKEIERSLGLICYLPEGSGQQARVGAFKVSIEAIVNAADRDGGRSGLQEVEQEYEWIANMLFIDPVVAKNYVTPLGQERFDKAVGALLMNADVAVSMPELGESFEKQVFDMAADLMIAPDQAEQRVSYLAGAVFSSLLEMGLEQHRGLNAARTDALLRKGFTMYKHPLLLRLQNKKNAHSSPSITQQPSQEANEEEEEEEKGVDVGGKRNMRDEAGTSSPSSSTNSGSSGGGVGSVEEEEQQQDLKDIGIKMAISRLGASMVMDLVRMLESARIRASGGGSGGGSFAAMGEGGGGGSAWGGSPMGGQSQPVDVEFLAFIQSIQAFLLKEFTAGNIRRGYTT